MSVNSYANSAFEAANSAGSYANSAFITANTANAAINTKTTINALNFLSAPSSNTQNTIFLVVDLQTGTPTTKKLSLSVLSERSANFAFQAANSAGSYANSAFAAANSATTVQSAFNTANASFIHANSSFGAANVSANLTLSFGATTILEVTHSGSSAYLFSQYDSLNNPNVSAFSATTLGFKLNVTGHPFQIRLGNNTANFDTGLVHVSPTGNLSYGSAAQGQVNGTLFWRIPHNAVGNYKYRCTNHPSVMIGEINVANTAGIYFAYNS